MVLLSIVPNGFMIYFPKRRWVLMKYQRIADLREDADLKQETIAKLLETSQTQYSRWERGEREIPFHHVITLAKYYKVSLDYIAGLTNNKNSGFKPK